MFDFNFPIPDGICRSFPHLVCNETPGLKFNDWCSVCKEEYLKKNEKDGVGK